MLLFFGTELFKITITKKERFMSKPLKKNTKKNKHKRTSPLARRDIITNARADKLPGKEPILVEKVGVSDEELLDDFARSYHDYLEPFG